MRAPRPRTQDIPDPARGAGPPLAHGTVAPCERPTPRHPTDDPLDSCSMSTGRLELLQGTLDLLLLKTLDLRPMHGWAIAQRVDQLSKGVFQLQQGSLYPALHRLEERGWITARWGPSENNRRARYYELTASGRRQLGVEASNWERLVAAVSQVLQTG